MNISTPKIMLGVIGNGRKELLDQTISSIKQKIEYPFFSKVLIDDTGDKNYHLELANDYKEFFNGGLILHDQNLGLSGSIKSLWNAAHAQGADYIFHVEEDFTFNESVNINSLIQILDNEEFRFAQVALKRQPWNAEEVQAGGFMQADRESYDDSWGNNKLKWTTHKKLFTLNPSLYPRWVIDIGWGQGWGEREFSDKLFSDINVMCCFIGTVDDPPLVHHTGTYRGKNWFV